MIFAIAKSDDMSAPDSIILQAVNLRVSAIITVIVPQALIVDELHSRSRNFVRRSIGA